MDLREESRKEVLDLFQSGVNKTDIGRRLGVSEATIRRWLEYYITIDPARESDPDEVAIVAFRDLLAKKNSGTIEWFADEMNLPPKEIRRFAGILRERGYRVPEADDGKVMLEKIAPSKNNLHKALFNGDKFRVGIVSDTHLASKEEAVEELHIAYDTFVEEGITEVWHAGDLIAGIGIYPTQAGDLKFHTMDAQIEHAVANYPSRPGIQTRIIAGNHDIEGAIGRLGANPVVMVCNQRDDMEYLGDYQAWIEMPNGAWGCLHHGRGGMSYAVSYKPQKIIEGLPGGRKPALMVFGHWHVSHLVRHRRVHALLGGCFEWSTSLMTRLGLQPDVGFWIVEATLAADSTLTRVKTEFFPCYEGRHVG